MRVELRDHTKPCQHVSNEGEGYQWEDVDSGGWRCSECPGGALRVFTYDGAGKALSTNNRGAGEFEGRKWQRWVEWLNDERTGR